ncbi:GNAT family N-acyltransferase [Microbispora sp. H10836]|uniref:GNAT family N-acyltransferase n=1 Tax=Microbispora sp. H10836 TaxID=2729106 RepID=UPI001474054D|nr:GNAT family N-acyltransferase [Microbispora sp. H10836]
MRYDTPDADLLETVRLEIQPPSLCGSSFGTEPWQREIRSFRGEVIYENGRFPHFRMEDGEFDDPDEHDGHAYHVLARLRSTGELIASARLAPAELLTPSKVVALDEPGAVRLLRSERLHRSDVLEGARWVVHPRHRGRRIGQLLVVASNVLGQGLERSLIWVLAGTAAGQDAILHRLGFREASPDRHPMPEVGDIVKLLACRPEELLRRHRQLAEQVTPAVLGELARIRVVRGNAPVA